VRKKLEKTEADKKINEEREAERITNKTGRG